jgi:hypothetical protein
MIKLLISTYIKNNTYNKYIQNVKIYSILSSWIGSTFISMYLLNNLDKDECDKYNDYLIQY